MIAAKSGGWADGIAYQLKATKYDSNLTLQRTGEAIKGQLQESILDLWTPPLSPVILRMAALRPRGISITSFDISYDGSALSTLSIDGLADTRSDLVTFRNIIEGDQVFSGVQVPISDLAPASHIQFSMRVSASLQSSP